MQILIYLTKPGFYCKKTLAYLRHLKSKFFHDLLTSSSPRSFGLLLNIFPLKRYFPSDWKSFIPFRLLSNLSNPPPSKILERHIFNYLYQFCSAHNILSNCQFGFQLGFSTERALLSIVNSWFSSLNLKNAVCAVFFDLTEPFNSVPHKPYSTPYLRLTFLILAP